MKSKTSMAFFFFILFETLKPFIQKPKPNKLIYQLNLKPRFASYNYTKGHNGCLDWSCFWRLGFS